MVNPDPPLSREGDPPIISEVPVIATTTEPPAPILRRPSPFRDLPDRLNQHLQQVTGFLTPLRASFAPFFNGSVQTSGIAPSNGRPPVVPQVSPEPVL